MGGDLVAAAQGRDDVDEGMTRTGHGLQLSWCDGIEDTVEDGDKRTGVGIDKPVNSPAGVKEDSRTKLVNACAGTTCLSMRRERERERERRGHTVL